MKIKYFFKKKKQGTLVQPGPIILAGTNGDNYDVLSKVNRNIKAAAVNELKPNDNVEDAVGNNTLTPGNKYYILQAMGFKAVGKNSWKHPFIELPVEFDVTLDDLPKFIFKVWKNGYHQNRYEMIFQFKKLFELK